MTSTRPEKKYQNCALERSMPTTSSRSLRPRSGTSMPSGPRVEPGLVGEHHRDEDAEAEGRDREVVALEAQDRAADEPGERAGERGAEDGGEAGVEAEVDRGERAGVAADPGEAGVAEADLAGIADQDHHAGHGEAVDEDQRADAVVVVRREEEGRGDDDDRQDEEGDAFAWSWSHPVRRLAAEDAARHHEEHDQDDDEGGGVLVDRAQVARGQRLDEAEEDAADERPERGRPCRRASPRRTP